MNLIAKIIERKMREQVKRAYDAGLEVGFRLGCNYGWSLARNEGVILGGIKVDKELEEILKSKGVRNG